MRLTDEQGGSDTEEASVGYRIQICNLDEGKRLKSPPLHQSGGFLEGAVSEVKCPNCRHPLFPVFKLCLRDDTVRSLGLWDDEYLQILVCAACPLYLQPYWTWFTNNEIRIVGGLRDKDSKQAFIEYPFESRAITLENLQETAGEQFPEASEMFWRRSIPPGVYHQIGGVPLFGRPAPVMCSGCKRPMRFAGMVDYDDLNVPLYETGHVPVALIIGDDDRLYFFTCRKCRVVGFQYIP